MELLSVEAIEAIEKQNLQSRNDQAKPDAVTAHARVDTTADGSAYIIDGVCVGTAAHNPQRIVGKIVPVIGWIVGIILQGTAGYFPDIATHV